jgi:hypothetical protein
MKYTLKEWKAEGKRRFGDDIMNWKFVCPACGRVNTGREFEEVGAEPNDMYQTCIGRHNGKGTNRPITPKKGVPAPEHGCNWAAFGLLGTLNGGDIVVSDNGKEVPIFSFAETETEATE